MAERPDASQASGDRLRTPRSLAQELVDQPLRRSWVCENGGMRRIGILLFNDDVEELDAVGLWEVLGAWAHAYRDEAAITVVSERDAKVARQVLHVIMRDLDPGR